jgi:hypothetical protein
MFGGGGEPEMQTDFCLDNVNEEGLSTPLDLDRRVTLICIFMK